jgi:hypothetical protein
MIKPAPVSAVETPEVLAATKRIMDERERSQLVGCLARHPLAGHLIPGTGRVRKLRWVLGGRGGARVVYYDHNEAMPIFALTADAKNERADTTQADRNEYRRLTGLLADQYARRKS